MHHVIEMSELRSAVASHRKKGEPIHFVPTMGALHAGHRSLMEKARGERGVVVVSIFVNPSQFGPKEDLAKYPRTLEHDLKMCEEAGVDLVYTPTASAMYPQGLPVAGQDWTSAFVEVPGISDVYEGKIRPGHFRGVATIVLKLFNQCQANVAYFGQKDAQQAAILRSMVRDLDVPVKLVLCPTLREADGLAMSSRNVYLNPADRKNAEVIFKALVDARNRVRDGERHPLVLKAHMKDMLESVPHAGIDYAEVVQFPGFQSVKQIDQYSLAIIAMRFGTTRLIDNMFLDATTTVV